MSCHTLSRVCVVHCMLSVRTRPFIEGNLYIKFEVKKSRDMR